MLLDELVDDARPLLNAARADEPPAGTIRLQQYCVATEVLRIEDEAVLPRLAGLHVLSDRTVHERFHYRTPGLFALIVRVYALPEPLVLPDSPHFAGCRSWVDLPEEVSTGGLEPVMDDAAFEERRQRVHRALVGLA